MSPLMLGLIGNYANICTKIDQLTKTAQEGEEINLSWYNFLHQCKYAVMMEKTENGVF
jgi:hypothetical protein